MGSSDRQVFLRVLVRGSASHRFNWQAELNEEADKEPDGRRPLIARISWRARVVVELLISLSGIGQCFESASSPEGFRRISVDDRAGFPQGVRTWLRS